ncbi:MAG: aromatic amino acid lyase [Alphaproteobacteria bacterium]|nr:aromatic amino acid lyase [Alphaproteobacteria bacterium]
MAVDVWLDGRSLTCDEVERVAVRGAHAGLPDENRAMMAAGADWLARSPQANVLRSKWALLVGGTPPDDPDEVVRTFVLGHCAGVGAPLPVEEVRALMLARANVLAAGWSGVRPIVVERLLALLDARITPVIPSIGEVGAAGSIQLAHLARAVFGFGGEVMVGGQIRPAPKVMSTLPPLRPTEKEGLALLNGATYSTALAALVVARAKRVLRAAEAACALSMEVVRADAHALAARPAEVRNHPGIVAATRRLRELTTGSELVTEQRQPDSFSIRCAPTVLGAARDALDHVQTVVCRDLNGVGDNPMVFPGHAVVEGGHFHGAPTAMVMDHLKVAMTQVASIAERRIFRLTYGRLSGLPSFLVPGSGVNSGLMLAQYTAASLLSEAKGLCMPASIDNVPTVQHHEDHVSMGPIAARTAAEVVDRVSDIVAIELLCGAQGLDFRLSGGDGIEAGSPGAGTRSVYDKVRGLVRRWDDDQVLHGDLVAIGEAVRAGTFS